MWLQFVTWIQNIISFKNESGAIATPAEQWSWISTSSLVQLPVNDIVAVIHKITDDAIGEMVVCAKNKHSGSPTAFILAAQTSVEAAQTMLFVLRRSSHSLMSPVAANVPSCISNQSSLAFLTCENDIFATEHWRNQSLLAFLLRLISASPSLSASRKL